MPDDLRKCSKPDCLRWVSPASSFCCPPCAGANGGLYELGPYQAGAVRDPYSMHTASCEGRHAERGPWQDPYLPPAGVVRPWASQGDNWEVLVSPPVMPRLPEPGSEEERETVSRYINARYGGRPYRWGGTNA